MSLRWCFTTCPFDVRRGSWHLGLVPPPGASFPTLLVEQREGVPTGTPSQISSHLWESCRLPRIARTLGSKPSPLLRTISDHSPPASWYIRLPRDVSITSRQLSCSTDPIDGHASSPGPLPTAFQPSLPSSFNIVFIPHYHRQHTFPTTQLVPSGTTCEQDHPRNVGAPALTVRFSCDEARG
ncbi:hypothetical protein BKA93DRAFT_52926 [Sparassis latifolia]